MTLSKRRVVKAYIAFCICMDADVFLRIFGGITPSANGRTGVVNNPIMFCFTASLIVGTVALLLPIYRRCLRTLLNNPWLTGLYLWSVLSIFWSSTPAMIVRGGMSIWALLLCGVIASRYLEAEEVGDLIRHVVVFLALLSIAFQLLSPVRETMAPGWTGVYGEKNHLGIGMGVGCIAQFASSRRWSLWRLLQLALFSTLLVLSQSTTSMGFVLITAVIYLVLRLRPKTRTFAAVSIIGSVILAFSLVPHLTSDIFAASGKDTNFTGRDVIWSFTLKQWKTRPLAGYGLYSFWESQEDLVQGELGWNPRQAHNGFLEVGVTTGIVGVVLLLGSLVSGARLVARARRLGRENASFWLLLSLLAILVDNVTEADFMIPGPLWFTYCVVYFVTYAEVRREVEARQWHLERGPEETDFMENWAAGGSAGTPLLGNA